MAERNEALEEQAVRDGSAVYSVGAEIPTAVDVPPGYKRTEVGFIPEDWRVEPILEVVQLPKGQVNPKLEPYRSMILVAPDHIEEGTGALLARSSAAAQGAISGKFIFKPGDVIYSKIRPYLKKAFLASFRGLCSADMYPLRPRLGVSSGFILNTLLSDRFTEFAISVSARSGIPKINRQELAQYKIATPRPDEQRAIATALSDADALIESLDRLIARKRAIKQAAMQQLLTGQTRLPGFTGEWETKRLGEIGRFRGGSGFPTVFQGETSGQYPFFKVSDMNNEGNETFMESASNYISDTTRKKLGAVVFPAKSIVFAKVGAAVFLERKKILSRPSCLDNNMAGFTLEDPSINFRFIHYVLLNFSLGAFVSTTALPSLNSKVLASIMCRLPSLKEQQAIATVLSDMDTEIEALERRRNKARQIKQGMMQQLLTGRVRLVAPEVAA